jgi:large subunit ribosomal protein L17
MLKNLASSLFLTEREIDADLDPNAPKVKGRVITTVEKAKEVRLLVERCITLARKSLPHQNEAARYATQAERRTEEWKQWRKSEDWQKWAAAMAPALAARRRAVQLLGDKQAVRILFEEIAPRYADRPGGYTRVMRLAKPRLGDAGTRAILEFVGVRDRVKQRSERPAFDDGAASKESKPAAESPTSEPVAREPVAREPATSESSDAS